MFHRILEYGLIATADRTYRPRAYGDPQPEGTWDGWLVFFPLGLGRAIAPPGPETTQSTLEALAVWAAGVTPVYLEGALARALGLAEQSARLAQLAQAEYDAAEDAEHLEATAEMERIAADLDEAAAREARADAERVREERLAVEGELAASEEAAATREANALEQAAQDARAAAADAARRRHAADAQAVRKGRGARKTRKKT